MPRDTDGDPTEVDLVRDLYRDKRPAGFTFDQPTEPTSDLGKELTRALRAAGLGGTPMNDNPKDAA